MPELPDVEGYRRYFERHAAGRTITGLSADTGILRNMTPEGLGRSLTGHRFGHPTRHGKWLRCPTGRSVASLDDRERDVMHAQVREVLEDSIRAGRVPAKRSWITGARNRGDPSCPRCRRRLERATVGGRTTYWCSSCQR